MWEMFWSRTWKKNCLITSQWCKLLTGTRGITDDDDDPQGIVVQFAWCEKGTWRWTPCKIFRSKASDVNLSPESEKLAIEACKLQSTGRVFPKLTSWIMIWCRQEAIRHRRALMNPTSMTRNGANDFNGGENNLRIQGLGWWSWKDGVWMYCSGWDTGESSKRLLLNIPTTLTWWIGSVNPKCGWCDGPMVMWPVNGTTQPDSNAKWKCHVQEWLATKKVFSSFLPNFPQSLLTSTSLFFVKLEDDNICLFYKLPFEQTHRYVLTSLAIVKLVLSVRTSLSLLGFNEFNDKDNLVLFNFRESKRDVK